MDKTLKFLAILTVSVLTFSGAASACSYVEGISDRLCGNLQGVRTTTTAISKNAPTGTGGVTTGGGGPLFADLVSQVVDYKSIDYQSVYNVRIAEVNSVFHNLNSQEYVNALAVYEKLDLDGLVDTSVPVFEVVPVAEKIVRIGDGKYRVVEYAKQFFGERIASFTRQEYLGPADDVDTDIVDDAHER